MADEAKYPAIGSTAWAFDITPPSAGVVLDLDEDVVVIKLESGNINGSSELFHESEVESLRAFLAECEEAISLARFRLLQIESAKAKDEPC